MKPAQTKSVKRTRITWEQAKQMKALHAEGRTPTEIATLLDVAQSTVYRYTVGQYKNKLKREFSSDLAPHVKHVPRMSVAINPETKDILTRLKSETGISENQAVASGLWLLLDQVTRVEPEHTPSAKPKPTRWQRFVAWLKAPAGV